MESFLQSLRDNDIIIQSGGGETADVGDLTPTVTVDFCAVAVIDRDQVIDNSNITPGLSIVGLASYGQASYENFYNSGIGSNGIDQCKTRFTANYYLEKYPETTDRQTDNKYLYCGPYKMDDPLPELDFVVGEALLSPTRTYAPVIKKPSTLEAISKAWFIVREAVKPNAYALEPMFILLKIHFLPIPPIFKAIQKASNTSDEEMYRVYNMGHRLKFIVRLK